MYESEDRTKRRQIWEKHKGGRTFHYSVDGLPPNVNLPPPKDLVRPEVVVLIEEVINLTKSKQKQEEFTEPVEACDE